MSWQRKLLALLLYVIWMVYRLTLRIRVVNEDKRRQAEALHENGCFTLALWHENIMLITTAMAGQPFAPIVSSSPDGELIIRIFDRVGFNTTRGSSTRGGRAALKSLVRQVRNGYNPAISVDGPVGPRHEVKPGIVQVARLGKVAILPCCARAGRMWRLNTWDRFRIPWPFTKILVNHGEPITIPEECDGDRFEEYQAELRDSLNALEDQTEKVLNAK